MNLKEKAAEHALVLDAEFKKDFPNGLFFVSLNPNRKIYFAHSFERFRVKQSRPGRMLCYDIRDKTAIHMDALEFGTAVSCMNYCSPSRDKAIEKALHWGMPVIPLGDWFIINGLDIPGGAES